MTDQRVYAGLHAKYYDLLYADKPYVDETRFVDAYLVAKLGITRGRLLDVACGSGRHTDELSRLGWTTVGLDTSKDLLTVARSKHPSLELHELDMTSFSLSDQKFAAITCLFDSLGYVQTNEHIVAALQRMREHLAPGGVIALEVLHAAAALKYGDPVRLRRCQGPYGETLLRVSETTMDVRHSALSTAYELLEMHRDGRLLAREAELHRKRFFTVEELRALLASSGLTPYVFHPAFKIDDAITADTWRILALAGRD